MKSWWLTSGQAIWIALALGTYRGAGEASAEARRIHDGSSGRPVAGAAASSRFNNPYTVVNPCLPGRASGGTSPGADDGVGGGDSAFRPGTEGGPEASQGLDGKAIFERTCQACHELRPAKASLAALDGKGPKGLRMPPSGMAADEKAALRAFLQSQ